LDSRATELRFERIAVLGLGVMGGSLARALSELERAPRVSGWSPSSEERRAARAAGAVADAPDSWSAAVAEAELVVLAAPLSASCDLVAEVARVAPRDATLSDVASLKAPLARAAARASALDRWVGAHPMAGSADSGFGASRADLYRGARVWTCAAPEAAARERRVHALWRSLGADPRAIDPDEHDRLMAVASHLPQLAANALATVLESAGIEPGQLGPGGRDMTRLASSSPEIWHDLLEHASPELIRELRALSAETERLAELLERGDLDAVTALMKRTRAWRRLP
jgi:prephenate dehydrogenase